MREREDEQRIRDRGRLGADRRQHLPRLQQDEVAVLAEGQAQAVNSSSGRGARRMLLEAVPTSASTSRMPERTSSVARAPRAETANPAKSAPSGIAPHAITRLALCTRPSNRSGTSAYRYEPTTTLNGGPA